MSRAPEADVNLRRALTRLEAPDGDPDFRTRLLAQARGTRRGRPRHARVAVLVAVLVAASLVAGAIAARTSVLGGHGATILDRTYSCRAVGPGGSPALNISGDVALSSRAGDLLMSTGRDFTPGDSDIMFFEMVTDRAGVRVDAVACKQTYKRVPLSAKGLRSNGVVTDSFVGNFRLFCHVASRVDVRARVTLTSGRPSAALVAISNEASGKAVSFINFRPKRIASYASTRCSAQ
jgi:hypothetical protein